MNPRLLRALIGLAAAAALVAPPQGALRRRIHQAGDALDDVRFAGTRRLYGEAATTTLRDASAMVVGVGGVGSWAAEAIARTGVGRLILVDLDEVCVSNTNRQLVALTSTVGKSKVEVLRDRLTDINPNAVVECVPDFVGEENADAILGAAKVDVVVDCIDNANDKVALLRACDAREQAIVVCGAAGGRRDPTAVRVRPGDVRGARTGDALLRATRKQWRRARRAAGLDGENREARVVSVYSDERPPAKAEVRTGACDMGLGSSVFATAAFGLAAGAAAVDVLIADGAVAAVTVTAGAQPLRRWLWQSSCGLVAVGKKAFRTFWIGFRHFLTFLDVFGSQQPLADGSAVMVDENYIRESILEPQAKVRAGYKPVMPTYQGQLKNEEVSALIAFIKSLSGQEPSSP